MKRILLCSILLLLGLVFPGWAQDRVVTGKVVTSEDNSSIPGVSVTIKGTTRGAVTDPNGDYKISVANSSKTLVFSFVGFRSQEIEIGTKSVINVTLLPDATELSEVVVTALGIKREAKTLSYASQQVTADRLSLAGERGVNNALAGKIAGVQVRSQAGSKLGAAGANSVRIRGAGSLTDKSPLYVVDGTPVNIVDMNMDDVESINVLKGPNATALYGQRAEAGVIVVTTKKAKGNNGIGLTLSSNLSFDSPSLLPKYQNVYGGGGDASWLTYKWVAGQPEEWKTFDGKKYHDYTDDASWGPKMDGSEYIPWYAWYPNHQYSFKTASFNPQPNNIKDFYNTGISRNTNLSFSKAAEAYNFRVSYTNERQSGITPNTELDKNYLSVSGEIDLGKHFTLSNHANYTTERLNGDFNDGYSNNTTGSFSSWFHRDLDLNIMRELKDYRSPSGSLISWNHDNLSATSNFNTGRFSQGNYWYNFYSYLGNNTSGTNRDRLWGDINLTYKLDDHFRVSVIGRRVQLTTNYENIGRTILEQSAYQTGFRANYGTGQSFFREDNYEFLSTYNNTFGAFSVDVIAGANIRKELSRSVDMSTKTGLVVPDLYAITNSVDIINYSNGRSAREVRSVYGRASLGYKDIVFLEGSARNDWSSTLPDGANSYFYPSVGGSFIFSEFTKDAVPVLSFAKLRANWAQVGSDLAAYQNALYYSVGTVKYGTNILMGTPNTLPNESIKPSLSSSYEGGLDLKFLKNRISFSATYYKENKINEILTVQVPGASGFTSRLINAGRIERNGVELQLEATPVVTNDFKWDVSVNFAKNKSKVVELTEGISTYTLGNPSFSQVILVHKVGEEWGQLRGFKIKRINGEPIINADGTYAFERDQYFGSVLPSFTGGAFTSLTYKNISLTLSLDFQKGGKFYSLSDMWGKYSGLLEETAAINDKGKNVREPVADGGGVKVVGVNANGEKVETYVEGFDYYHQFYGRAADFNVFDASYLKIREINVGYNIPVKKIGSLSRYVRTASVSFIARNPWIIYVANRNIDSSEISASYGENGQLFGTSSYGFNIKLGF